MAAGIPDSNGQASKETPESAYVLMHARVRGGEPQPGDLSLSAVQYDAERRAYLAEHNITSKPGASVWPPTSQTLMKRLGNGSWAEAMHALNLTTNAGRQRGAGSFTDDDYRACVGEFLAAVVDSGGHREAAIPSSDSFAQFTAWLAAKKEVSPAEGSRTAAPPRRPSAAAVRRHFDSWEAAKESANLHTDGA